jgi:multiple sugar transport system substrate-binding protein
MVRRPHLLALLLVLVMVAACGDGGGGEEEAGGAGTEGGGGGDGGGGGPIVFWHTENLPDRIEATQAIIDSFTEASGIEVEVTPIAEDELPNLMIANAASGDLPDVVYFPLDFAAGWAEQGLIDPEAASAVIEELGAGSFSQAAIDLATVDEQVVAVPSDGWGQLLVYRQDLFDQAGLQPPESYEQILAAAQALHNPDENMAGITLATDPADVFTQQTFEHIALANGCTLVDDSGEVALGSAACAEAIEFYATLANEYSPGGAQTVDTTRATYFAGQAAMVIWSPFILDEMAGLRQDALPTCPECQSNPAFLAENSGLVGPFTGGDADPAQYGQVSYYGIGAEADTAGAQALVSYMLSDGYMDWLDIAPEGKFPMRLGESEGEQTYVDQWRELDTGVDETAPLGEFYGDEIIESLRQGVENFDRWGYGHGAGEQVSTLYETLVVPQTLNEVIQGGTTPQQAAETLASEVSS